ncbi:MAG: phospho-N-acetylmuramoyl-pentapeptide-transferase, partial [Deltaproteobacteria bacterium RBG_16_71_12]
RTLFLYPPFIRRLQIFKFGQEVRKDGPESHFKKQGTPTMGGVLILAAVFLSTVLWSDIRHKAVWLLLLVTIGYGCVGFYDDYKKIKFKNPAGLAGRWKLLWQFLIGGVAMTLLWQSSWWPQGWPTIAFDSSINLPFVNIQLFNPVLVPWLYLPLALVFVVVGTSNAVNLTDGLDGLAIGPIMVATFTFLVLAYAAGTTLADFNIASYLRITHVEGAAELSIFCAAVLGAGIGFLWYNAYPALVFMGDVGALALGGALGMLAIFTKNEILSAVLHGVFLAETISVMLQTTYFKWTKRRTGEGKRLFLMTPIHHHFEKLGWPEPRVIVRFWIVSVMLALVALASLKLR